MRSRLLVVFVLIALGGGVRAEAPLDPWSGRTRHRAVVNPVARARGAADVFSLRGDWNFICGERRCPGIAVPCRDATWRTIRVPSCWEAEGVGESGIPPSYQCQDSSAKPMRHVYQGVGIYRKDVTIPDGWQGRRIWLAAGGILAQGWLSVNETPVGWLDTYCGSYKWEITDLVQPGTTVTIQVVADNTVPCRGGALYASGRFGGIYRDIELQATPEVLIDDVWAVGDFDARQAHVKVEVEGKVEKRMKDLLLRATVEGGVAETPCSPSTSTYNLNLALHPFRPWSPEHPNLYTARVELVRSDGTVLQMRVERFGVRKLEVVERGFRLNGKSFFLRQCGDNHPYPLTGLPPADRNFHRAHLAVVRAAGFNAIRLHTHCEVPEYFEAADELGLLIEAELPYYGNYTEDPVAFDPLGDARERREHFRRHPSYAIASGGNEGAFARAVARRLYMTEKREDPDRLVLQQDGGTHVTDPVFDAAQTDYFSGPLVVWERGSFDPGTFVAHEYLNLAVKSDSRDETLYSGIWLPPARRADRAAFLARFGLDHTWGDRFQTAAHRLQAFYQKSGLESARMDPFCDGYCFWTVCDTVVQRPGTDFYTAQGLFNPFWQAKRGGLSPEAFARFNAPTVVLADFDDRHDFFVAGTVDFTGFYPNRPKWQNQNRIRSSGDALKIDFRVAHAAEADIPEAVLEWKLTASGRVLTTGRKAIGRLTAGPVRAVGREELILPDLAKPCKAVLEAKVGSACNTWNFWLFPRRVRPRAADVAVASEFAAALNGRYEGLLAEAEFTKARVVIAAAGSDFAVRAERAGKDLVLLSNQTAKPNVQLGWWWVGDQAGTAIRPHPLLGDFPCDEALSPLFFRILRVGTRLPVASVTADDLIIAGEGQDGCFLHLADVKRSDSARTILVSGLDVLSDTPEGTALLDRILAYLRTV